jgi:elongator complex protein 3
VCLDTRSREVRNKTAGEASTINLVIRWYASSVGQELFISYEDHLWYLYGFTRLLLPAVAVADVDGLGASTAIIRELHVYWTMQSLRNSNHDDVQHTGFWKALMWASESISSSMWFQRLSVISGVWVRQYYKGLWYVLEGTYMVKYL